MNAIAHYCKPWQLLVSVCLTRANILCKELNEVEMRYSQLQDRIEFERSVLNNYELTKTSLTKIVDRMKIKSKMTDDDESKLQKAAHQLMIMQEEEDTWEKNTNTWNSRSSLHDDDDVVDYYSIDRKFRDVVHLVVNDDSLLNEETTMYPYTDIRDDESLKTAADRLLGDFGVTTAKVLSNSPIGVVRVKYKENEERGTSHQGAKMFFMKAFVSGTDTSISTPHKWLVADEFEKHFNCNYYRRVKQFVL